jgi:CheY-like chemotaxis protein
MAGSLFLIHWNELEAAEIAQPLIALGWQVEYEAEDGARAGKRIRELKPDVIVVYLSRLPSHGRETAHALRSMNATRSIPVVFVDGKQEAIEKTRLKVPGALFVTSAELDSVLARLDHLNQSNEETIQCLHPDPAKSAPRISKGKYETVKRAILGAISLSGKGIFFKDLPGKVASLIPGADLDRLGSVSWYTTTVKLDLEARGLIERIPGSRPQRLRLKQ